MPILVTCPACTKMFRAADEAAGQSAPCPHCQHSTTIAGPTVSPFDAFISYSSKDKTIADAAVATLEAKGIRCWVAPRDITPGKEWSEAIIDGIGQSRMMVLVFSTHANGSQQVLREVERAVNRAMPIVPFRIENLLPSKAMEYFISTHHWLDAYHPPLEDHLEKLAATCESLLTGTVATRKDEAKDLKALLRSAVKTLSARDNRPRVLVGAAALLLLVGVLIVGSIYAMKDPKAAADVIQAKADAEVLVEDLKKLDHGQGMEARLQELDNDLKTGQASFDQKKFPQALTAFRSVLEKGPGLKEADKQRQEAKKLSEELEKAGQGAANVSAEVFAPGQWSEAQQRLVAGQKAFDAGDFAAAKAQYNDAIGRYREARQVASESGKARRKALALWTGYGGRMILFADSIKKTNLYPSDLANVNKLKSECATIIERHCEPQLKLKDNLLKRLRDARDEPASHDLMSKEISNALFDAYGLEVHASYWLGNDLALVHCGCLASRLGRIGYLSTFASDLRLAWRYAYEAGAPEEITSILATARQRYDDELKKPRSLPMMSSAFAGILTIVEPLWAQHLKDPDTATEAFRKPRAEPPLPPEQQAAIRELLQLGAEFVYKVDKQPLRPIQIEFPKDSPGTAKVVPHVVKLPSLKLVYLYEQNVTDEDLAELQATNEVTSLSLFHTKVTDAGLAHLAKMTGLEWMSLAGLPITDQGLEHLTGMKKLKTLLLKDTQVTPTGIARLKKALPNLEIQR